MLKWAYGVTTVPSRRWSLLPGTLRSLMHAGFPVPRLFVDGLRLDDKRDLDDYLSLNFPLSIRTPVIKTAGNWVLSMWELYIRDPAADRYAIFQDDFVTYKNLRQYLEAVPYPENGYLNLMTFCDNERIIEGQFIGWHEASLIKDAKNRDPEKPRQTGRSAVALVFSRKAVLALLSAYSLANRFQDVSRGWKLIDGGVVEAMNGQGFREYIHNPSLVSHTGTLSTMRNGGYPSAKSFRGEDFNALDLLKDWTLPEAEEPPKPKPPTESELRMKEHEALRKMVAPGTKRPGKWREGVIQIWVTRACDKACFGCTQGSNLAGKPGMITPEQFEQAVLSLKDYFGVIGVFGGNPSLSPHFETLCEIMRKHVPFEQRGLWCNNPMGKAAVMRKTFNPLVSNLNVHLDKNAYDEFRKGWPESRPFGLKEDSRHSPVYVAMKDVIADEGERWDLIADCDINKHWSAMLGVFRGQLRAWFCEVAGAQAMLHQHEPDYPDTGLDPTVLHYNGKGMVPWWQLGMNSFTEQVKKHCHECGVPLRGYGELAQSKNGTEQFSETHADIYRPKTPGRLVQLVTDREQVKEKSLKTFVDYLGNSRK